MIIFKIKPTVKSQVLNFDVYNYFFVRFMKDWYTPFFYMENVLKKIKHNQKLFNELINSGLRKYYSSGLYNDIESVKYIKNSQSTTVSDFLILRGLVGKNENIVPNNILSSIGGLYSFFDGVDTIAYMFNQYKTKSPLIYGDLLNTRFHSHGLILLKDISQSELMNKVEEKVYGDLVIKEKGGVLKLDEDIVVEPELLKVTNNTMVFFVFPYVYVRGQLDYKTGIVNKYEFVTGRKNGYFKLVDSRVIDGSFIYKTDRVGLSKMKEFDSISRVVNSINYFLSKGVIEHHILPVYSGEKTYLFIKAKKGDWISVLDGVKFKITIDRKMCSKSMGGFVKVIVDNKYLTSFYSINIAGVINPGMSLSNSYVETCGQKVYEIKP